MKNTIFLLFALGALTLSSCGGAKSPETAAADPAAATTATTAPATTAAAITVNEAEWQLKDLKPVSSIIPISMKLPKSARLEKNGNAGVDATIGDSYTLVVYQTAISAIKEGIDGDKQMYVKNSDMQTTKIELDEPNGFIYTVTYKGTDGKTFPGGTHFVYYYAAKSSGGETFFSVHDEKAMSGTAADDAFTVELAKQVYALVKGSVVADK